MGLRVGDLVVLKEEVTEELPYKSALNPPGLVIKLKKREIATQSTGGINRRQPVQVKVLHTAEVVWPGGYVSIHSVDTLERIKNND